MLGFRERRRRDGKGRGTEKEGGEGKSGRQEGREGNTGEVGREGERLEELRRGIRKGSTNTKQEIRGRELEAEKDGERKERNVERKGRKEKVAERGVERAILRL